MFHSSSKRKVSILIISENILEKIWSKLLSIQSIYSFEEKEMFRPIHRRKIVIAIFKSSLLPSKLTKYTKEYYIKISLPSKQNHSSQEILA